MSYRRNYLAADPTVCGASQILAGGRIRTSDNPCGAWCSFPDFRDWKAAARFSVDRALPRTDLPATQLETLRRYAAAIDGMSETMLGVGDAVRKLARIHQSADCAALWDPVRVAPSLPTVAEIDANADNQPSIARTIETVALLAAGAYILSKVLK